MTLTRPPRIGDRVSIDHPKHPGVWIVRKVARVNATLEPENGGRLLRCPFELLVEPRLGTTPLATIPTVHFDCGEFVRITSGRFVGLYVVLRDSGGDKVNVAKPGGDGGRYVRAFRAHLAKVDPQEVLK